jgi:hypothetical protein
LKIKTWIDNYLSEQKFITKCVNSIEQYADHIYISYNCINLTKKVNCKGSRSFRIKHDGKGILKCTYCSDLCLNISPLSSIYFFCLLGDNLIGYNEGLNRKLERVEATSVEQAEDNNERDDTIYLYL